MTTINATDIAKEIACRISVLREMGSICAILRKSWDTETESGASEGIVLEIILSKMAPATDFEKKKGTSDKGYKRC